MKVGSFQAALAGAAAQENAFSYFFSQVFFEE